MPKLRSDSDYIAGALPNYASGIGYYTSLQDTPSVDP